MPQDELHGIIPPMVTPFLPDESLDLPTLRREARYLLSCGIHGISVGGSTGEGALLSDDELAQAVAVVQAENRRRLPVLCGIIRNATRDAVRAGLAAHAAGADVLMVTPTYYHGTDDAGNVAYFREIAETVGLPIIIYNVIPRNPIAPPLMHRLAEIEGIIGIKQSVGGLHALADMLLVCGTVTRVFGAQDDLLFAGYGLGACGAISAILTLFPEACVRQWELMQTGEWQGARALHEQLLPVWRRIDCGMAFPGMIKAALALRGRAVGVARRPILPPEAATIDQLRTVMAVHGWLDDEPVAPLVAHLG
jgi:dihydrodipicolinate synthase/N-acetylneuraminate lyase